MISACFQQCLTLYSINTHFFFIILHLYASINTGTLSIFSFYIEHDCNIAFECSLNVLKEVVAFKIKY